MHAVQHLQAGCKGPYLRKIFEKGFSEVSYSYIAELALNRFPVGALCNRTATSAVIMMPAAIVTVH